MVMDKCEYSVSIYRFCSERQFLLYFQWDFGYYGENPGLLTNRVKGYIMDTPPGGGVYLGVIFDKGAML